MAHDEKAGHAGHHDEIAHPLPVSLLVGVWVVLMGFTGLTVWCAQQGLGSQTSFIVAMIIATIKAGLVMAIFMHLWWDKRLNLFVFLGSFLFVMLFIGMALTDKSEYKSDLIQEAPKSPAPAGEPSPPK